MINIYLKEAILQYMTKHFKEQVNLQNYKIDEVRWVKFPIKELKQHFDLSPFQQRNIIKKLNIRTKLGRSREKYFTLDTLNTLKTNEIKAEIIKQIENINNLKLLKFIKKQLEASNNE